MGALAVVGGGDVFHPAGVGGELEAFPEGSAGGVFGVVNGNTLAAVACHDGETGDIGRAVTDVNHVFKGDGPLVGRHVVVHVLIVGEHAFVDAEQELSLGGVGDGAFGEADASFRILAEFAAKHGFYIGLQA